MKIFWNNAVSDNFSNTTDWSTGTVPGPADIAVMTASGIYTVTADGSSSQTVLGINTGSGATLAITNSSTFIATAGTVLGANRGTIAVSDSATLQIGSTFNNPGAIALEFDWRYDQFNRHRDQPAAYP